MAAIVASAASALAASAPSIAAASASAAASSTLAATAISIGKSILLNLAVSSAMSLLNPQVGEAGRPVDWTLDPDGPIPFAAGRVGAAGAIVHKATFGPDLMYYGLVSVLSGAGPIKSFQTFKADEETVTFDAAGKAVSSQWRDEMWMKTQRGLQPTTAAMTSPAGLKNGASLPGWGSSHRMNGKAGYIKVMGENSKRSAYPNGETKPLWVIEGLYGWDPRQDSTYPGGSGSCRLNDPATWVYIERGPLWALKWALGLWEGPIGKGAPQVDYQVGGIGAKVEGIDVAAFVNAQNISDAYDWKVAAYPTTDDNKAQVLDGFLQASGCIYAQKAGKISCIQRAAPRASIVTITAADTAGPIEFSTAASRINRINTLRPRFWDEGSRWQMTAISEVSAEAYRAEDGAVRSRPVDFPYVPNAVQCGQLAALQIANTREGIAGTIPLKPHLQRITPGDAFTIIEPGFLLDGVKCLCLSTNYDPATGIHSVTFVSETDSKYPFALGQSPDAPVSPTITAPDLTVTPPFAGHWEAIPREATEDGIQLPIIDVVGAVANDTATGMIVEWGVDPGDIPDPIPEGSTLDQYIEWNQVGLFPPTTTAVQVQGPQPGASIFVAVRNVRNQNYSARLVLGPVDVPNIVTLSEEDTALLERLDRIDSDGWLTKGEKPFVLGQYESALAGYLGLATQLNNAGLSSQLTAFNSATTTLQNYINALNPPLSDFTTDTEIVGQDLRYAFEQFFTAKQAGLDALVADARNRADDAAADASEALAELTAIFSDNLLTRNEKPRIIEQVAVIQNETTFLRAQALAFGATAERTAYIAAYDALMAYLASLSPAWNSLTTDTPIVGQDLRYAFEMLYLRRQEMLTAQMGITDAEAAAALSRLAIIDSDGWLSKGEKPQVIREWEAINAQFPTLRDQAGAVGATTQRDALVTAKTALDTYLSGLTPAWNDPATDTAIVSATFRARFTAYYQAAQNAQSAIATAVGADGAEALAALDIITSDNWLDRTEKPEIVRLYSLFNSEYPGLSAQAGALGLTAQDAALATAIQAFNAYVEGLSPSFSDLTTDTPVVGATLRSRVNAVYLAKTALQNAMAAVIDGDASLALSRLDVISSDAWLSRGEKPAVIQQWAVIQGEFAALRDQAGTLGVTGARTAYISAYDTLAAYLASLSPAWNDLNTDTPINGADFRFAFQSYYIAKQAVQNAIAGAIDADVALALAGLDAIASDNILSRNEKPSLIEKWAVISGETGPLRDQATALAITGPRTTYIAAHDALGDYLNSLAPAWNDLNTDTPIVGPDLRFAFQTYYIAKQALLNAIAAALDAGIGEVEAELLIIGSDNWISTGEKSALIREHANLQADVTSLTIQANALGITTQLTTFTGKVTALTNYLNSLSPAWNNVAVDTPVDGPTLRFVLYEAFETKQALLNAIAALLDADIGALETDLTIIASDSWLSRNEKPEINRRVALYNIEYAGLADQANALGISPAPLALAIQALNTYLGGLSPSYSNTAVNTPIDGPTFRAKFNDVEAARTALLAAIAGAGGGDVVVTLPNDYGEILSGNGFGPVVGGTWQTLVSATLANVTPGQQIFSDGDLSTAFDGNDLVGQVRLVEVSTGAVIAGPLFVSVEGGGVGGEDGYALGGASTVGGSQQYRVEARQTGSETYDGGSGLWTFSRIASATTTNPGYVTPEQVARWDAGAGGGVSSGSNIPFEVGAPGSNGRIRMQPGDATYTGFAEFLTAGGARRGFVGYAAGGKIRIDADAGYSYGFNVRPDFAGQTPYDTGNLPAPSTTATANSLVQRTANGQIVTNSTLGFNSPNSVTLTVSGTTMRAANADFAIKNRLTFENSPDININTVAGNPNMEIFLGPGGAIYTNQVVETSDVNAKKDIRYWTPEECLALVIGLKPAGFRFKDGDKPSFGFLAQDVVDVAPEAVSRAPSGVLAMNYGMMAAPTAGAIIALLARLEASEAATAALLARTEALETEVAQLRAA